MEGYRFRVLVRPQAVDRSYGEFRPGVHHGQIMPGDWDLATYPVTGNPLVRMAFAHWRDGVSWEETGIVEHQMARIQAHGSLYADGLRVRDDVLRRYERLDELFEITRRTGEFPPEANAMDGIYMHLDREDMAVFGQRGVHRFVIASVLGLEQVVAQLGGGPPAGPPGAGIPVAASPPPHRAAGPGAASAGTPGSPAVTAAAPPAVLNPRVRPGPDGVVRSDRSRPVPSERPPCRLPPETCPE